MNNLTLIGVVGRDAQVVYFKPEAAATVTTFWIATQSANAANDPCTHLTTWHKITAHGRLQQVTATIQKGDLVAVSGPIRTGPTSAHNSQSQSHSLHANAVEILQRNSTSYKTAHANF